jgi:hypothetical protein
LDPANEPEFLISWLTARIDWMNDQFHPMG